MECSKLALSTWRLNEKPSNFIQTQINLCKTSFERLPHVIWWNAPYISTDAVWQSFCVFIILKLTPLTDRQSSPSMLDLLDHFVKFLLFVFSQKFVIFNAGNVQLVLGFWLWGLKWAGQDGEFDIFQDL